LPDCGKLKNHITSYCWFAVACRSWRRREVLSGPTYQCSSCRRLTLTGSVYTC